MTMTWVPTLTPTVSTDGPCGFVALSPAYPNPVLASSPLVRVRLTSSCPTTAHWSIVTVDYRMVLKGTVQVSGRTTLSWNLKDGNGKDMANGLYYFLLRDAKGTPKREAILLCR
jgi:hypothetical protein